MSKGFMDDREKAFENSYFRQQDAKLIKRLRMGAGLDEIAVALAEKLEVDDPTLLARARGVGITAETAPAFFLAPLVQVAWAEDKVGRHERDVVLRIARERGIAMDSPSYAQLVAWLDQRPPDDLFEAALDVLKTGFAVLPQAEREERIERIVHSCREVAADPGAGAGFVQLLGLGDSISGSEGSNIQMIADRLRGRS